MRKINNRIKIGEYEYAKTENGYRVWGKEFLKKGINLPPDERLLELNTELQNKKLSVSLSSFNTWLGLRGIIEFGKRKIDLGRKALNISSKLNKSSRNFVTVGNFWPIEVVRAYTIDNEEPKSPYTLKDFRKTYLKVRRTEDSKGFEKLLAKAFPEYPGFYSTLRNKVEYSTTDRERVTSKLLKIIAERRSISQEDLSRSEEYSERRLSRQVTCLASHDRCKYLDEVSQITNLGKSEISLISEGRHACAYIAENLTKLLFVWAPLVNVNIKNYAHGAPKLERNECTFSYIPSDKGRKRKLGYADLRIGDIGIDSKTGAISLKNKSATDIEAKYALGKSIWEPSGSKMTKGVIVFHEEPRFYDKFITSFKSNGINIFPYKEFHEILGETVSRMKKTYSSEISEILPRIHNLSYLLHLHKKISHEQTMRIFIHSGNREEWRWSNQVIKGLIIQGMVRYD